MSFVSIERDWKETVRYRAQNGATSAEPIDFYTVEMSSVDDTPDDILKAVSKLNTYAPHPKIKGAFLIEPAFDRVEGTNLWKVEARYSTEIEQLVNPLGIPPIISTDSVARTIIRLVDAYGKPKCNTAGDIFDDPAPEVEIYDIVYVVAKNLPTQIPDWYDDYANCVNSDGVRLRGRDWEPGELRYVPKPVGEDKKGGPLGNISYCEGAFELHARRGGWKALIPNRGFNELIALPVASKLSQLGTTNPGAAIGQLPDDQVVGVRKGKKYVRRKIYIGPTREEPNEAQALDKNGRLIPVPTPDNIVMLEFDDHEPKPFGGVLPLK